MLIDHPDHRPTIRGGEYDARRRDSGELVAGFGGGGSSYPGGKSGSGIAQRLINLIPRHEVFVSAFAGRCGVLRAIQPAEHTIVIDADASVCNWWDSWRRSPTGRSIEIHHCDSIEWLRHRFGLTQYSTVGSGDAAGSVAAWGGTSWRRGDPRRSTDIGPCVARANREAAGTLVFCDPPYVLSQRSHGKQYACELSDGDHRRLVEVVDRIAAAGVAVLLCGYRSPIYASLDRDWRTIDHRVMTRGGLRSERIWLSYPVPNRLHDTRYVGGDRRERERIRRRQRNWVSQLDAMPDAERQAMIDAIDAADREYLSAKGQA